MNSRNESSDAREREAIDSATGYPRLTSPVVALVAAATEAIVRERLGDQASWTAEDSVELRAAISQLNDAVETLHHYELGNEAEPSFVLSL
ncbi:MAG: hypothetical protein QOK08_2690 [Actinomycetota bacterium]|jgi:hypothetical protein|nr:hypothetical protein [Actinomycetota bacterium]